MDTLNLYGDIVENTLLEYTRIPYAYGEIQTEAIFDRDHDHYVLINVGWDQDNRVHGSLVHILLAETGVARGAGGTVAFRRGDQCGRPASNTSSRLGGLGEVMKNGVLPPCARVKHAQYQHHPSEENRKSGNSRQDDTATRP